MPNPRDKHPEQEAAPVYSGRDVRQGDIVLRKPWERGVFAAGLIGAIMFALVIVLIGMYLGRAYSDRQAATSRPAQVGLIIS